MSCSAASAAGRCSGVIRPAGRQRSRRFASEEAACELDGSMARAQARRSDVIATAVAQAVLAKVPANRQPALPAG
jgi:hypothetical protein